jgi:hypothetical protein
VSPASCTRLETSKFAKYKERLNPKSKEMSAKLEKGRGSDSPLEVEVIDLTQRKKGQAREQKGTAWT